MLQPFPSVAGKDPHVGEVPADLHAVTDGDRILAVASNLGAHSVAAVERAGDVDDVANEGNLGDAGAEVAAARAGLPAWAAHSHAYRIEALRRFANVVRRKEAELAELIARETGKPLWETRTEVAAVVNKVDISVEAYAERTPQRKMEAALGNRIAQAILAATINDGSNQANNYADPTAYVPVNLPLVTDRLTSSSAGNRGLSALRSAASSALTGPLPEAAV